MLHTGRLPTHVISQGQGSGASGRRFLIRPLSIAHPSCSAGHSCSLRADAVSDTTDDPRVYGWRPRAGRVLSTQDLPRQVLRTTCALWPLWPLWASVASRWRWRGITQNALDEYICSTCSCAYLARACMRACRIVSGYVRAHRHRPLGHTSTCSCAYARICRIVCARASWRASGLGPHLGSSGGGECQAVPGLDRWPRSTAHFPSLTYSLTYYSLTSSVPGLDRWPRSTAQCR